jgi:hypothetical protein
MIILARQFSSRESGLSTLDYEFSINFKPEKKGGVGKTTLCILLHEAIRQTGQRIAVRDFVGRP